MRILSQSKFCMSILLFSFGLSACGTENKAVPDSGTAENDASPEEFLLAPDDTDGFQLRPQPFTVAPGEEVYYCYSISIPIDEAEFLLGRVESRFSVGAHHLLISTVDTPVPQGQGPCSANDFGHGITFVEAIGSNLRFLSGAQTPYSVDPRSDISFSEKYAFYIKPQSTILLQLHWANTTDSPQVANTAINFWRSTSESPERLESYFFYHREIALPPGEKTEVAGRCAFPENSEIVGIVSHMHARGTFFTARHFRENGQTETIYEETSWQEPEMKTWFDSAAPSFKGSDEIEFRCFFENTTSEWIYEGDGANDEMCMLIGIYTGGHNTLWGFPGITGNRCRTVL